MKNFSGDETFLLGFDPEEIQKREETNRSFILPPTGLRFIDDHYGPRPACLHTLLGSTGRGKSTLLQSLIVEWGRKAKMLVYLTEESFDRMEAKLAMKAEDVSYLSPKLHLLHEQDLMRKADPKSPQSLLILLRDRAREVGAQIIILDNITTSLFYEGQIQNATPLASGFRRLSVGLNLPIFFIAHTKKGVSEATKGLMTPDDIRGAATFALMSDYFYVFYRIRKTPEYGIPVDSSFIHVAKSRDHDNQDNIYRLEYDPRRKLYFSDKMVNFNMFKSFMKERDRG